MHTKPKPLLIVLNGSDHDDVYRVEGQAIRGLDQANALAANLAAAQRSKRAA